MSAFQEMVEEILLEISQNAPHSSPVVKVPLINALLHRHSNNSDKSNQGNRYDEEMHAFSSLSAIYCGASFYKILAGNSSLPSRSTALRHIAEAADRIEVSLLDWETLDKDMERFGTTDVVISEDATRLDSRISYDPATNALVGLVAETDPGTGLPFQRAFIVSKPSQMVQHLENFKPGKFLQIRLVVCVSYF